MNDLVEASATIPITSYTEAAWVYPTSTDTAFHAIIGYQSAGDITRSPTIYLFNNGYVQVGFGNGTTWSSLTTSSAVVTANTWNHIAATFDGTTLSIYVNGVLKASSAAAAGKTPLTITHLQVGHLDNYFQGSIDEVALYDRAMSAAEVAALQSGRYNPDDQVLAPGDALSYSALVTNTLTSQAAYGHLTAEDTTIDPALTNPTTALRFESADRKSGYRPTSGEGEAATCTGTTCPSSEIVSSTDRAAAFDGVDDVLTIGTLAYQNTWQSASLSLKVKLSSYPSSGQAMTVLATDTNLSQGMNISITSAGHVLIGLNDVTPTVTGVATLALNTWTTIKVTISVSTANSNQGELRVYVNGTLDSGFNNTNSKLRFVVGAGYLGNGRAGTSPLNGSLNDLQILNYQDTTVFTLGFDEDNTAARTTFTNTLGSSVTCASTASCPALASGVTNDGLRFDGTDDYLPLTTDSTFTSGASGSLSFKLKLTALPAAGKYYYLVDTRCSSASGAGYCLKGYINSTGVVGIGLVNRTTSSTAFGPLTTTVAGGFSGKLGSWVTVQITWALAAVSTSASTFTIATTYNSVTTTATSAVTGTYWPLIASDSATRVGLRISGNDPLAGVIDDLALTGTYSVSFDQPTWNVQQVNRVNDARSAACANLRSCPTAASSGKFGSALSFDGVDDAMTLDRTVSDDFTVAFWLKTTQTSTATSWWAGSGLVDGEVSGTANDFGVSLGSGQVLFGTGSAGGQDTTLAGGAVSDGSWHHVVATRVKTTGAMRLYVDGAQVASGTGSTASLTAPPHLALGSIQTGANYYSGLLDEVVILPAAVDLAGAKLLMQTTYPIIDIPDDFTTFKLNALSSATISAAATVSAAAATSQHQFTHEVEAAIDLQTAITYPVNDSNYSSLPLMMPFEEVPGATDFTNYGYVTGLSQSAAMAAPFCDIGCPTAGLRGMVGRAATFDGIDDWLTCTYSGALGLPCAYNEINVRTVAAWVKADRGTIVDFRSSVGASGIELDYNKLNVTIGSTTYSIAIDLPENEWAHVAATVDTTARLAKVYVNGALYGSTSIGTSGTPSGSFPSIGANRTGTFGNKGTNGDLFHGMLDDLRAYTVTLSAAQIKALYAELAPILQLPFDADTTGASTVGDTSTTKATGVLSGGTCNTVTISAINFTWFEGIGFKMLRGSTNETLIDLPTVTDGTTALGTTFTLCGEDTLSYQSIAANGTATNFGTNTVKATTIGSAPLVYNNAPFNEFTISMSYGTPAAGTPPVLADGKIGNKLIFDGDGAAEFSAASTVAALTSTFTLMAWVRPDDLQGTQQILASGLKTTSGNGIAFSLNSGKLQFVTNGVKTYSSSAAVSSGLWQHVAVVFDSAYAAKFYVNGTLQGTVSGSAVAKANSDDPLYVGGTAAATTGLLKQRLRGQLDEVVVFDRELTQAELYSIYLRDLRWYSARSTTTLQVDTDAPTVKLLTADSFHANLASTLVVSTTDSSSSVRLLDVGIKKSTSSTTTWTSAPLCAESVSVGRTAAWCPSFDPTTLGGSGSYALQFRAVDAVGNQTTTTATIYVDTAAPTVSSSYNQTTVAAVAAASDSENQTWTVALTGTASDPTISSGVSGSGVTTSTLLVGLYDATGALAGTQLVQPGTVSGTTWSASYTFTGVRPTGLYTVKVTADDTVGNAATTTVGTVVVDAMPPAMEFQTTLLPSRYISTTKTLSGVFVERPRWGSQVAGYHFEETSGATSFTDATNTGLTATCSGTGCPTITTAGQFGGALTFDGSNDYLSVPTTTTLDMDSLTFAAWVKPTALSGTDVIASRWFSSPGVVGQAVWQLALVGGQLRATLSTDCGTATTTTLTGSPLSANSWAHVALTVDTGEHTASLYLNGALDATVALSGLCATSNAALYLGDSQAGNGLAGLMDEAALYRRALTADELYTLAQSRTTGASTAQVWLAPDDAMLPISPTLSYDFSDPTGSTTWADSGTAGRSMTCSGTACPSVAYGHTDQRALTFDGVNDGISATFAPSLAAPHFTESAWINPTFTDTGYHAVMGYQPGSNNGQRPPSIYVTERTKIHAGFGDGSSWQSFTTGSILTANSWNHIATTFDGTAFKVFVNGTAVYTTTALSGKTPYPISQLRIGQADTLFQGAIDQVRFYSRALSASDVALLASDWKTGTVGTVGNSLTSWSYTLPTAGMEGLYQLKLRGTDVGGNTESPRTVWRGMVDTIAPSLAFTASFGGGGTAAATTYVITATDRFIDTTRLVSPCPAASTTTTYTYDTQLGEANRLVATCQVAGFAQGTVSATAYDRAGNSKVAMLTLPAAVARTGVLIISPSGTLTSTQTISITGGAYAPSGIRALAIRDNGTLVRSLIIPNGTTDTIWATSWAPLTSGDHLLTAVLTDTLNTVTTDSQTVTLLANHPLSVTRSGTGGRVSSAPSGIDCGADCSEIYAEGTTVTLTAAVDAGWLFSGWGGACSGTASTCVVTLSQARTVSATFMSSATATPTTTATATTTATPTTTTTATVTATPSATATATSTTAGPSATATATSTAGPSATAMPSTTATSTPSTTAMATPSTTATPTTTTTAPPTTAGPSATATATSTAGPSATATATSTAGPSATATATSTATSTARPSATAMPSTTATSTPSTTAMATPSTTTTATATATPSATATATSTTTPSTTATATNTAGPSATATATHTPSSTATMTPTATATNTAMPSATTTNTAMPSATATNTAMPSATVTATATNTAGPSVTMTSTATPSSTATMTPTATTTNTAVPSVTATATATNTAVPSVTMTSTATPSNTATITATATHMPSSTATMAPTATATNTVVPSPTATSTAVPAATTSPTPTIYRILLPLVVSAPALAPTTQP